MSNSDKQQENNQGVELIARFAKCPWCGSTDRMMGRLAKEMVEQGLLTEGIDIGLAEVGGPIIDPSKTSQMLSVSTRSGMFALRDICVGCGREITVKIEKKPVTVGLGPPPGAGGPPMSPGLGGPR